MNLLGSAARKWPFPAVLVRSPYPFGGPPTKGYEFFAKCGYAVIAQYVRGRCGAEGEWLPYWMKGEMDMARSTLSDVSVMLEAPG